MIHAIAQLPKLDKYLNSSEKDLFFDLINCSLSQLQFSTREKRSLKKNLIKLLQNHQIERSRQVADLSIDLGIYSNIDLYLGLLKHPQVNYLLDLAYNINRLYANHQIIINSIDKASKVIFCLKKFAEEDDNSIKQLVNITEGLDLVLNIYRDRLQQIEVIKHYQYIPKISNTHEQSIIENMH